MTAAAPWLSDEERWSAAHPGRTYRLRRSSVLELIVTPQLTGIAARELQAPRGQETWTLVRKVEPKTWLHGFIHRERGACAIDDDAALAALWREHFNTKHQRTFII